MLSAFRRLRRLALIAVFSIGLVGIALPLDALPAAATGPTVTGAGSTWVQIALDQWRADIARQGYSINYQGVGSSAGREFYIINQVDFAASEIPFQPDELNQIHAEHKSFQYMPDVAGGTSLMYNLHTPGGSRITSLRLNAATAAGIFTGTITTWQNPAITALNPGLQIRETRIIPVIRSDGSGTSAQFSLYLASQAAPEWNAFVAKNGCAAPCSLWPPFFGSTQQNGSDGVANFVANDAIGSGAIGYVEAGYAFGRGFPVASLHNASGNYTQPTAANVATALRHATLNPDLTQNLNGVYVAPEPNAYPMSSYSYLITQTTGFDPAKGAVLGAWIIYIACGGQQEAAPLGYSPLPPNLVAADFAAVRRIPGAPTPPPIDHQHCPNPTVGGSSSGGGGGSSSASGGGGNVGGGGATVAAASSANGPAGANGGGSGANSAGSTGAGTTNPTGNTGLGGLGGAVLGGNLHIPTLSAAQRKAYLAAALRTAATLPLPSLTPFLLIAALLLGLVFLPMFIEVPRRAAAAAPASGGRSRFRWRGRDSGRGGRNGG